MSFEGTNGGRHEMKIKKIQGDFTVCKVTDYTLVNLDSEYCFTGKTKEEKSLVCLMKDVPANTIARGDGWKAFYIDGVLEFSLIGILAKISNVLAKAEIGIFVVSAFNTDYIFVKAKQEMLALSKLAQAGYRIETGDPFGDYFLNRSVSDIMGEYGEQREEWN